MFDDRTYAQAAGSASPSLEDNRQNVVGYESSASETSSLDAEPHSRKLFEEWSGESMEWTPSQENFFLNLVIFHQFFPTNLEF